MNERINIFGSFAPCSIYTDSYFLKGPLLDWQNAEEISRAVAMDASSKGFYSIAGRLADFCLNVANSRPSYAVLLVPIEVGILEVIKRFKVGSHIDLPPEEVYQELEEIEREIGLAPFFADQAGIKLTLSRVPDDADVSMIMRNLISIEAMEDEMSAKDYIVKNRVIHLWWD